MDQDSINTKLHIYCEKSIWHLKIQQEPQSAVFPLTLGVNMWAMPSTAPLSSKPRTRKQNSTTYGKRELKYITWVRASPLCYTVLPWIHSFEALQSLSGTHNHTQTSEWIPKTALCLLVLNLWYLTKCGEDSMRLKDMSQKSFLQHFGESFQYCLW